MPERESHQQRRAKSAYEALKRLKQRGTLAKVKTRAQGLPVEVRTQGLTVAVATLLKEGRSESGTLADLLAKWLLSESGMGKGSRAEPASGLDLLDHAVACSRSEYLTLQSEALAYLEHVKRLASALESSS